MTVIDDYRAFLKAKLKSAESILSDAERNQVEVKLEVLQEELRKDPGGAKNEKNDTSAKNAKSGEKGRPPGR